MNFKQYFIEVVGMTQEEQHDLEFNHHQDYYNKIIDLLGYENVKRCMPVSIEELKKSRDEHFNDIPLYKWDLAAGFVSHGSTCELVRSNLTNLYRKLGVNTFSCSCGVCILKQCARRMLSEV